MRQSVVPERNGPDILPDIADADKVLAFLTEELHHGRRYTGRSLEAMAAVALKMTRIRLRAALAALEASGRLEERELPAGERHGARRYYLHPTYCAAIAPLLPDLRAALRRVPAGQRPAVAMSADLWQVLTGHIAHAFEDCPSEDLEDSAAQEIGNFWYSMAAGEPWTP